MKLEQVWRNCLRQWEDVIKILDWARYFNIKITTYEAKELWVQLNRYKGILNDCFFCQYADRRNGQFDHPESIKSSCSKCPGTLVDSNFSCEPDSGDVVNRCWVTDPRGFRKRLLKLNNRRLKRKETKNDND